MPSDVYLGLFLGSGNMQYVFFFFIMHLINTHKHLNKKTGQKKKTLKGGGHEL